MATRGTETPDKITRQRAEAEIIRASDAKRKAEAAAKAAAAAPAKKGDGK